MTKKYYQLLAQALQPVYDDYPEVVMQVCKVLKEDNPRFDINKFLDYLRGYK